MDPDPSLDGYRGRNFVLPPLSRGQGRFRDDIVIGDDLDEAEDWLKSDHYFDPNIPRVRRARRPTAFRTDPDAPPDYVDTDKPYLVGSGPAEASTSTALVLWPQFKYDVNGYYRVLDVSPWATKVQLREAYRTLILSGAHPDVLVRATYCFKQLLVKEIRRDYDGTPYGEIYLDSWEMKRLRDEAKAEAVRRRMQRGEDLLDVEANDAEAAQILDEQGWSLQPEDNQSPEAVDKPRTQQQNLGWQFSYYRLRSTSHDRLKLGDWQAKLISALASRGARVRLVVGFHRDSVHPWKVAQVGERLVAFLRDTETPTDEQAGKCADLLVSMTPNPPNTP